MSFVDIPVQVLSEEQQKSMNRVKYKEISEIEGQVEAFLKSGGKIKECEVIRKDIDVIDFGGAIIGSWTGVTEMPDGWFRVTYRGFLIGKGHYKSRKGAEGALTRHKFKDGQLS